MNQKPVLTALIAAAVLASPALAQSREVNITTQLKTQLNTLVPSVSITPPAGWRPGGQQQGAAPAPAAAQPAKPAGR